MLKRNDVREEVTCRSRGVAPGGGGAVDWRGGVGPTGVHGLSGGVGGLGPVGVAVVVVDVLLAGGGQVVQPLAVVEEGAVSKPGETHVSRRREILKSHFYL